MKTSKTLIALTLAAVIPLGTAMAGDQYGKDKDKSGSMSAPGFDKLDTNRDGRISQAEASVDTNIVFSSADANGDGYLDKSEWKAQAKGSTSPTPQSTPDPTTDPAVPPSSTPAPSDTETPRQ
jgi:EF hand domain-containing protein